MLLETDVKDFPIQGIVFKDIALLFRDINLFRNATDVFIKTLNIGKIVCIEFRGFLVGPPLVNVPIRKNKKMPFKTIKSSYS